MSLRTLSCVLFTFIFQCYSLQAQFWSRAAKAASHADDLRHATKAPTIIKGVEAGRIARYVYGFQAITPDINKMEVLAVMDRDELKLISSYSSAERSVPHYLNVGQDEVGDAQTMVQRLAEKSGSNISTTAFNELYENKIIIEVHADVLQHPSFAQIDWGDNLYIFDGHNGYPVTTITYQNADIERVAKISDKVYMRIIPGEVCTPMGYAQHISDLYDFINNPDDFDGSAEYVQITGSPSRVENALSKETVQGFIKELTSSGIVIVDAACGIEDNVEKYIFGVYEEPTIAESYLEVAGRIAEVKIDPKKLAGDNEGWSAWVYIAIGVGILILIGSFVKD